MKIAISAAIFLGLAQYSAAFPCYWNGGGSSYVYDFTRICNYDDPCITCLDNVHAQTTCCRCVRELRQPGSALRKATHRNISFLHPPTDSCASKNECDQWDDVYAPNFNPNPQPGDYYLSKGCDLSAPQISIGDSAGGASLPGQWFTSQNQLLRYLESTVQCTDDCIDQPSCNIGVDYKVGDDATVTNQDWRCGNTLVTVTSTDWCVREQDGRMRTARGHTARLTRSLPLMGPCA